MRSFEEWRPHLIVVVQPIRELTGHKNLEYFSTKRQLNQRQVRWSGFMAQFLWYAEYRPVSLDVNQIDVRILTTERLIALSE